MGETLEKSRTGMPTRPAASPPVPTRKRGADRGKQDKWVSGKLGVTLPPDISDSGLQLRPSADAKAKGLQAAARNQQAATAQQLAGLPAGDAADAIRDALAQHGRAVPKEVRTFRGIDFLDDVTRIDDPEVRTARLTAITETLDAVRDRRAGLLAAIRAVEATKPTGAAADAVANAWKELSTIDLHLPDEFQGLSGADMKKRIGTLLATPDEKKRMLAEAKSGFKDDAGKDVSADYGKAFKGTIEGASAKGFDRQRFYFDEFVSAPPPEKLKAIAELGGKIAEQGQKILDCGGTLKDVEALMAKTGIPQDWWPPRLIDTMQAWRKTERAMLREKVAEKFKELPGLDDTEDTIATIKSYGELFASTLPKSAAEQTETVLANKEVAESIKDFLEGMAMGWGVGQVGLTAMQMLAPEKVEPTSRKKMLDGMQKGLETIESAIEAATAGLEIAEKCGADIMSGLIPGLALAKYSVKLAMAIKMLGEHSAILVQTKAMRRDGRKALGNAEMEDGGAFLNALENEIDGRNKQVAKDSIKVTTASMDVAGAAAGTFGGHYGMAAQGGLKIAGGIINVGSAVVFTNIDWAAARSAKKTLKEAQSGNPVARMEVFKDHNTYAKMYLCLLVQDGNPLAEKFLVQRGIEESDLNDAMSLKILREALLDSADQKAEDDIPDNLLLANTGKAGEYAGKALKAVGGLGSAAAELRKDRSVAYDPNWAPGTNVVLTEKGYDAVKKQAIAAGLFDEETGIGDALKKVDGKAEDADKLLAAAPAKLSPGTKDGDKLQSALLAAVAALSAAVDTTGGYGPVTNPKDKKSQPHAGMVIYCGALMDALRAKRQTYEKALVDRGLKDPAWQPTLPPTSDMLSADAWSKSWAEGVQKACLPKDDAGMEKALKAVATAQAAWEKAAAKPQDRRKAALKLSDALNGVIGAAKDARPLVAEAPNMGTYLQRVLDTAAAQQRTNDSQLGAVDWVPRAPVPASMTSAAWTALSNEAEEEGYVSKAAGDGGVLDALKEMEKRKAEVDAAAAKGGKPLLKARQDYALAAGAILLAQQKFIAVQRDVPTPIVRALSSAYTTAMQQQTRYDDDRASVGFATTVGVTSAAWTATYRAAVEAGAVPEAKGAAKSLAEALEKYASEAKDMAASLAGKDYGKALRSAKAAEEQIDAALKAIDGKLLNSDGYSDNQRMSSYLTAQLRPQLAALKTAKPLADILAGNGAGAEFPKQGFTWAAKDFSAVKARAIELGVIQDQKTGMSEALEDRAKADAAWVKAKAKAPAVPKDVKAAADEAASSASRVAAVARSLEALSSNANWVAYAKAAQVETAAYLKQVAGTP